MTITVAGAGAFGTALAVALSTRGPVRLWARDASVVAEIERSRAAPRLPGVTLPDGVSVTHNPAALAEGAVLLAIPAQAISAFAASMPPPTSPRALVACCKGIDLATLRGPSAILREVWPDDTIALLTGPSFAGDIARGMPTALVLACADDSAGRTLQADLSTPALRVYRTTDLTGAELGGALKNVMAIACGACIGAGMGESARAALLTRGFAEMQRLAARLGADPHTLMGLSGLGDLVLTATSEGSRNYRYGQAIGRGEAFAEDTTVEGVATAKAASALAERLKVELPVTAEIARLTAGGYSVQDALEALLNRPLKEE
jgi:glycerol-3-phosphate dehydrogenase (NAD(P)+)